MLLGAAAAAAGCSPAEAPASGAGPSPGSVPINCEKAGTGDGLHYCLVDNRILRVPGGAALATNHAQLLTQDDNNAAILARDENGFFAFSAICTHQCCLVTICGDAKCSAQTTNPGSCAASAPSPLARSGPAFLCPCHGSAFAADGTVLGGPAKVALRSIAVTIDGVDAVIDLSQEVAPTARA